MGIGSTIVDVLSGGALGGITGLLGTGVSAYTAYKNRKAEMEFELIKMDKDRENTLAEADAAIKVQQFKTEGEIDVREADAFKASMEAGMKSLFKSSYAQYMPGWLMGIVAAMFAMVDMLRSSVRPVVTYFLVLVSAYLGWKVAQTQPEVFFEQAVSIVGALSYLTVTCVTWWFGDRRLAKVMAKKF